MEYTNKILTNKVKIKVVDGFIILVHLLITQCLFLNQRNINC